MIFALECIRVPNFSQLPPGAYCTMILGDLGADVIRISSPNTPSFPSLEDKENRWSVYDAHQRNKKSLILNLKDEDARQVFYKLAEGADVIVQSFRPGVVKRLGIDYEKIKKINSRIIYCALSGFGQDVPYSQMPGHDINYIYMGGVLGIIGEPDGQPIVPSNLVADFAGASLHGSHRSRNIVVL